MWIFVLIALFSLGFIFHALSKFYYYIYDKYETTHHSAASNVSDVINKLKLHTTYSELVNKNRLQNNNLKGLYMFEEIINSVLYTYGMLLLISLPRFPNGWSLRMLTGWYSLYCSLVAVSYRASMTAILAKPASR